MLGLRLKTTFQRGRSKVTRTTRRRRQMTALRTTLPRLRVRRRLESTLLDILETSQRTDSKSVGDRAIGNVCFQLWLSAWSNARTCSRGTIADRREAELSARPTSSKLNGDWCASSKHLLSRGERSQVRSKVCMMAGTVC